MMNLAEPLDVNARSRPGHPALVSDTGILDHAAFADLVRRYAAALRAREIGRGSTVAVALKDTPDHLLALFAVARVGAVVLPVDWRLADTEKRDLFRRFEPDLVLREADAADPAPFADAVVDAAWRDAVPDGAPPARAPGLPAVLSLSSGTTGPPTGPLATHGHLLARLHNQLVTLTFNQHDRYLSCAPLCFGGGRSFALGFLMIGGTVILRPPPFSPAELVAATARARATVTFLVPTLIRRLLALPDAGLAGLASLRLIVSSGAPLHPEERAEIAARLPGRLFEYYASTEGGGVTVHTPEGQRERPDSCGRAAFMVDLEVVDGDGRRLPPDEVGRIRYRGPGVATEPGASAGGWFYPGDLGRMDADGYLYLMGRATDVIIRGGVNIHPREIERRLCEHRAVAEAAVFGRPAADLGEEVAAAVTLRPDAATDAEALRAHCREALAPYKVPASVTVVERIPRSPAGKVLKAELARLAAGPDARPPESCGRGER